MQGYPVADMNSIQNKTHSHMFVHIVCLCVCHMKDILSKWPCGTSFSVDHAMIFPEGGFPIIRHKMRLETLLQIC